VRRLNQIVMVDTGACYGGELSAYCPETGEIRQVPGLNTLAQARAMAALASEASLSGCLP
jgi:serine/threonine protein phosphatase 1